MSHNNILRDILETNCQSPSLVLAYCYNTLEDAEADMKQRAAFVKDKEAIINKLVTLRNQAQELQRTADRQGGGVGPDEIAVYFEIRTSALNLLAVVAGPQSIYYRMLQDDLPKTTPRLSFTPGVTIGILNAAISDFREGFMADARLLISAEVLSGMLEQAKELLENQYKDAAAVLIRAVLEDGLRRLSIAKGIDVEPRAGIRKLADRLVKENAISKLQHDQILAMKTIGDSAAHAQIDKYRQNDVERFCEFVSDFVADII